MRNLGINGLALMAMGLLFGILGLLSPCATTAYAANLSGVMTCAGDAALAAVGFVLFVVGAIFLVIGWKTAPPTLSQAALQ